MNFKNGLLFLTSITLLCGCSDEKNIVRGPSDPETQQGEIENPHLVRGIGASKLQEIVDEAYSHIFDITSYKSSKNDVTYEEQGTKVKENFSLNTESVLYNNSVLHLKYTGDEVSKAKYHFENINEEYYYINEAFTEIRSRRVNVDKVDDVLVYAYSPVAYERLFYPEIYSKDLFDMSMVSVAGYLSDERVLMQIMQSTTVENYNIDNKLYVYQSVTYYNFIAKDNKLDEFQLSNRKTLTDKEDETISFQLSSSLFSETFAYDDNGDFDKTTLPGVTA